MVKPAARSAGASVSFRRTALLIATTAAVAVLAFQKTAGTVLARRAPDLALRIAPNNAFALGGAADRLFAADPAGSAVAAGRLAERAQRAQGFNAQALRGLGYAADVAGRPNDAAALIGLSERLSRRDKGAQIWLIERAVNAGDVPSALRHYDIALRTSTQAPELLYPILTGALDQDAVRSAFVPYVRSRPLWMDGFLAHAISYSAHPETIAALLLGVPGALADPRNGEVNARLVERLLAAGRIEDARRVYLATPGWSPARLTSPALSERDRVGRDGVLGWRLPSTPAGQATLDEGSNGAVLHVEVTAGSSGQVAQKTLLLPPGRYRFAARTASAALGEGGSLRWRLACTGGAVRRDLWARDTAGEPVTIAFAVEPGCAMQSLTLDAVAGESPQGASADVADIAVRRD